MSANASAALQAHHGWECEQLVVAAHSKGAVLSVVNVGLQPGRLTAIVGPNGAGKSTLMACLAGLGRARSGCLRFKGQVLSAWPAEQLAQHLAFMAQDTQVAFGFTSREVVEMGRYPHRRCPHAREADVVQDAMQRTGVAHLADREVASLSGGERARVQLARVLAQVQPATSSAQAGWMLLDEPTAALDVQHQHACMQLLKQQTEQGVGVVAVLHDLNLALRYAHDVVVVPGGGQAAVAGSSRSVLCPARIQQVWGMRGELLHMQDGVPQYVFGGASASPAVH